MSEAGSPNPSKTPPPKPQRQWPLMVSICFVAIIAAINLVDFSDFEGGPVVRMLSDKALVNILSVASGMVAFGFVAFWFFAYSAVSRSGRIAAVSIVIIAVAALLSLFRIEAVRGDLRPEFRLRWLKSPDRELAPIEFAAKVADLGKKTPLDFPQFLGPTRSLYLANGSLNTDWASNPPQKKWSRKIGAGWSAFSAVNGFAVTQEQRGDEELVTCYEIETGDIIWTNSLTARHETTMGYVGPRATPTIHGGDVYSLGATGILQRIAGATGKTIWKKDLLTEQGSDLAKEAESIAWGRSASPLIVENLVIIPLGGPTVGTKSSLAAYDLDSGEEKWRSGNRQASYASPKHAAINGEGYILTVNEDSVSAHEPTTGRQVWEHAWRGKSTGDANCSQPMVINANSVMVTKGYGQGSMLLRLIPSKTQANCFDTEIAWTNNRALRTKFTNVVVVDDFAYGLSDGLLQCIDARTGEIQWKASTRFGNGQILGVDRHLLVQSESGEITLATLSAEKYQSLGTFQGLDPNSGACWNNMCLYGNTLLLRNSQEAACWELPLASAPNAAATR
jgi:outer membrane protein assembly factor BamB